MIGADRTGWQPRPGETGSDVSQGREAAVPLTWQAGDTILDLYEVRDVFTSGGMGLVYRVHHRTWKLDLAVKSPRPELFRTEAHRQDFVREAETWVDLGLHPHTVSCYYVRTLGGIPRIFAEFVEGGSLKDWIRDRRLYAGGSDQALARILDVAIQFAWGLAYAHEQGLVHQDVKPANVLMTPDGTAKVTDFGLARARQAVGEGAGPAPAGPAGILVSVAGMTPAYCSPEQAARKKLTLATDVWSWAVSVLEMFTGGVTWLSGVAAPAALEMHLEGGVPAEGLPPMPAAVADLLRHCFQEGPEARPGDMLAAAGRLQKAYLDESGRPCAREMPRAVELRADSLNNRALSLLDLGRADDAEAAWEEALEADPRHAGATYNLGLWRWRSARQTDVATVQQVGAAAASQQAAWRPRYLLGLVHLERGDGEAAARILGEVSEGAPAEERAREALGQALQMVSARCLRVFQGHTEAVECVALTPDGRHALSGSADETLRMWDVASGECVRTLEGHRSHVAMVVISPDGRLALSGSVDGELRLWELPGGRCLRSSRAHAGWVHVVALVPGGRYALSGSADGTLRLWDLGSEQLMRALQGHQAEVTAVCVSQNGRVALSGSADNTLRLWDLANGRCLRSLAGHTAAVAAVAFVPGTSRAVSGGVDRTLRLWDLEAGRCLRTLEGHEHWVRTVVVTPDGRHAVSGGRDMTVRLWDVAGGRCLRTFEGHRSAVGQVAITPDGRHVISAGSYDKTLRLWGLEGVGDVAGEWELSRPRPAIEQSRQALQVQEAIQAAGRALADGRAAEAGRMVKEARQIPGYERAPELLDLWHRAGLRAGRRRGLRGAHCVGIFANAGTPAVLSPDGSHVAAVDVQDERVIGLWSLPSGDCLRLEGHGDPVRALAFTPDGRFAVSGGGVVRKDGSSPDSALRLWDLAAGRCLRRFPGHSDPVVCLAITPDGRHALSGSSSLTPRGDDALRLWDLATGRCLRIFEGCSDRVIALGITPGGRHAVSGGGDGVLRLWDLQSGQCLRTFQGHRESINNIAIARDGRRVLTSSGDETLRLWDLEGGACLHTFQGHGWQIDELALTPDGRAALSASWDRTLRLWDLGSGECLHVLEGHTNWVIDVAVTADGRYALSGGRDRTARLWELEGGRSLHTIEAHEGQLTQVLLTPDGHYLLSASSDRTIRLWELDWDYGFLEPADWADGAQPYLETFLTLHIPFGPDGIRRAGKPAWKEEDLQQLLTELSYRDYGWLRPEGVRRMLEEMAARRGG